MSTFKNITCEGNMDYNTLTKNGETYPKVIWEGAFYMNESQSITIDMDSYPSGIELQWSRYDANVGAANNYGWHSFFYSKEIANRNGGIVTFLVSQTGTALGLKYIYISKVLISGHANNDTTVSGTVFGNIDNKNWALRRVVAF